MLSFIGQFSLFLISFVCILILPGTVLAAYLFRGKNVLSTLERFVIAVSLSIASVDFYLFALHVAHIKINRLSLWVFLVAVMLAGVFYWFRLRAKSPAEKTALYAFSSKQFLLAVLFILLTFVIKTAFLQGSILPSATDAGHHMFWSNWIVQTQDLTTYGGLPDFIIGEHTIFAAMGIVSGLSFISAWPILVLYFIDILSILAVFILTLRIFKNKTTALLVLFFSGVLYAVTSPQAKFVSGGVVGNIFGNFLLPLCLYWYYRSLELFFDVSIDERQRIRLSRLFLWLGVLTTFTLFYTHHLTSFILAFIFFPAVLAYVIANRKHIRQFGRFFLNVVCSKEVLITFILLSVLFVVLFPPNYIHLGAVGTAVGTPTKDSRAGLAWHDLVGSIGEARLTLGLFGLLLLLFFFKKENNGYIWISAWAVMIFIMSTEPHWLLLNLPSDRIGNYLSYPLAILSAYAVTLLFEQKIKHHLIQLVLLIILVFAVSSGLYDSVQAFKNKSASAELAETFRASAYLKNQVAANDAILKDHNYLTGDAWIKIFFMRGYTYPLSRGLLKRYDDTTKPRENCTLVMISDPMSTEANECFQETGVNFLMVNPLYDAIQFRKAGNFDKVYTSTDAAVYYKLAN